jgi:hypothetical protein
MRESFDWLKPCLLWQADGQDYRQSDFFQPHLLEFRSDEFMDEFLAATVEPGGAAFGKAVLAAPAKGQTLKLFQPAHGCFYLLSASLCCRQPGFPDREIRSPEGENVFFVLRKFVDGAEYGWVMEGQKGSWRPVNGSGRQFLPDEERLPLLSARSCAQRTLWFGYLPVAGRETYAAAPKELPDASGKPLDLRLEELGARFVTPLIKQTIAKPPQTLPSPLTVIQQRDPSRARDLSVFILLELYEFFETYLKDVATALNAGPAASLAGASGDLLSLLRATPLNDDLTLAKALGAVADKRDELNRLGDADMEQTLDFGEKYNLATVPEIDDPEGVTKQLLEAVKEALPEEAPPAELPKFTATQPDKTYYAARCVYERPQCEPVFHAVSPPSAPFQLAPYFDPDAPARPVRIPLPTDISIAGLRKFKKGVTFLISDSLQKKISRLTGKEKELLKDNPSLNEEDEGGLAFICSFSIQIIFIVAFMLLLMFVIIFNLVFWWIAFFRICLPVPKKLLSG